MKEIGRMWQSGKPPARKRPARKRPPRKTKKRGRGLIGGGLLGGARSLKDLYYRQALREAAKVEGVDPIVKAWQEDPYRAEREEEELDEMKYKRLMEVLKKRQSIQDKLMKQTKKELVKARKKGMYARDLALSAKLEKAEKDYYTQLKPSLGDLASFPALSYLD